MLFYGSTTLGYMYIVFEFPSGLWLFLLFSILLYLLILHHYHQVHP